MPSTLQNLVIVVALVAVAIVLVLGLWNMMKGGSPSRSQNLMRLRVLLQAVAIFVVMIVIWMLGR
jgi:FtsZ-interacting cell division protein ZipA